MFFSVLVLAFVLNRCATVGALFARNAFFASDCNLQQPYWNWNYSYVENNRYLNYFIF